MIVRAMTHLDSSTTEELEVFERQFLYPLGPADSFSISHGPEYMSFFSAMGAATLLVAEHKGKIVGTMVLVRRQLLIDISGCVSSNMGLQSVEAHYICDLKIGSESRSTSALARLVTAAATIVRQYQSHACYAVVMTGTKSEPTSYTGRINIPEFKAVAEIVVVRILSVEDCDLCKVAEGSQELHRRILHHLSEDGVRAVSADLSLRSNIRERQICHENGSAVGLLEDTRRGKRLLHASGAEIVSSHLTGLRWSDPIAASDVLRFGFKRSLDLGYPAMFCAVPRDLWSQLEPKLNGVKYQLASATVYGYAVPQGVNWWIDTSEI